MNALRAMSRLLEIKRRMADAAEAEYAKVQLAVIHAQREARSAEQTWHRLATEKLRVKTVADLEDHVMSVRLTRRIADAAAKEAAALEAKQTEALQKLTEAKREVARYETWLEREEAARAAEERRLERLREDEHASRKRKVA